MTVDLASPVRTEPGTEAPDRPPRTHALVPGSVLGIYVALSFWVFARLWKDLDRRYLADSWMDQNQWEWFFAVTARSVAHLENPLFTTLQNYPDGVNMMANTVMLGLGIPLTPVTLAFGPTVTWALVLTFGLAGTAAAWYWVLLRHVTASHGAAAVGGGFCAFAPPVISHANAHPNFVALFVLPLIISRLLRLAEGRRVVRNGVLLGLLAAYQVYLGEEVLLLAATGLVVFAVAYGMTRERLAGLAAGGTVACAVFLPLVGYPLMWQFGGPQSYDSLLHGPAGNDLEALTAFAGRSLAGNPAVTASPTEQNAFFGWSLAVLVIAIVIRLRRLPVVRGLAAVIVAAALLSLGPEIIVHGEPTGLRGPWHVVGRLPLYESVVESRLTMVCVPAIGALLALATERARPAPMWALVLAVALVPIAPRPLVAEDRPATPEFFARDMWRQYVRPGRSLVPAPLPSTFGAEALHWQIYAGLGFPVPGGYFVGPDGTSREGTYGAPPRPTSSLLRKAADDEPPGVTDADRAAAAADLRFWKADLVVVGPHRRQDALRRTVGQLLGSPGRPAGGVWIWEVRL